MASSYLTKISKSDLQLKKLIDFTKGIFIDNSGSTSGQLGSLGKNILAAELSICEHIQFDHIVLWNSSAEICKDIKYAKPTGGTDPQTIFKNTLAKEAFNKSDVIVFVTDGEIGSTSVTQFETYTKDNLNKALIVCIIVNKKLSDPSKIDISVVAPLMMNLNVLCLFYDGETFYVLSSKGYISNFYKVPENLTAYTDLNTADINELFHNIQVYEAAKIPNGCIGIREDENEIDAFDFEKFINIKDFNLPLEINEEEWKILIQYAKVGNKLNELRTFIRQMKNKAIQIDTEKIKTNVDFKYMKQREEIVTKIVLLKTTEKSETTNELVELRQELKNVSDQAKIEELKYIQHLNSNLNKTRQYWNNILGLIQHQETGSYSINDFTFKSKRANRAKTIDTEDSDYLASSSMLDHSDVPLIECSICMEQGPTVLWLKSPVNLNDSTNDIVISYPLQESDNLRSCIVSNPVCGLCASTYINATATISGLQTLYREPCSGFIPLNWSLPSNRDYSYYTLCRIFTGSKMLYHVSMLILAIVDDHKSNWFTEQTKAFLIRQIVENISSTDSFTDEGTRMPFIDAIKEVIKQEDKFFRQPFTAVCRILNFNYIFNQLEINTIITILRKRFILMCIQTQCFRVKYRPQYFHTIKQQLYNMIFDTFCGIPIPNTFKRININDKRLKKFLKKTYDESMSMVDKLAANIGSDRSIIFPGKFVSFALYLLTTVTEYERPMKLYTDLAFKYQSVRGDMDIQWAETVKIVNESLFDRYNISDDQLVPSYAINLGACSCPSKLFFGTKPLWSKDIENQHISVTVLTQLLRENLSNELRVKHGNDIPNKSTAHYLLHSTVAQVIEESYPNAEIMTDEIIMDCLIKLARTGGNKGNIYQDSIFSEVVLTTQDYLKFRKTTNMADKNDSTTTCSYKNKIIMELAASGIEYDKNTDTVLFDVSRLKVPRLLVTENSDIDFKSLKIRIQQLYIEMKAASNKKNRTCLNIEIKDLIEFKNEMDTDALLAIWRCEEQSIASSIVIDVDQIEESIEYIAGLAINFTETNDKAVASMIVFDYENLEPVAKINVCCDIKIPCITGYSAFRDCPVFMKIIDILKENCPELMPQVILMNDNGVWHPKRAGIASYFSILSGIPCFGVSKNLIVADGITQERVEQMLVEQAPIENQFVQVVGDSGAVLGLAYNITGSLKNAVYISAGHKITLQTACDIFKKVTKLNITEPVQQADQLSRDLVAILN